MSLNDLDGALEYVRHIAAQFTERVSRIEIVVRADGRVTMSAEDGPYTRARVEADLCTGGELQFPSAAFCDLRDALDADAVRGRVGK